MAVGFNDGFIYRFCQPEIISGKNDFFQSVSIRVLIIDKYVVYDKPARILLLWRPAGRLW